ncbi:uncharacterized protein LOC109839234 [Asparagus officinalis]|uniref:uncharacterized protein LOC109839234 n=1 Tax=Asparagus officinalis TaxID=4686 RepID=UPI00098DE719|nr:uncharacterized protein LOC109839234 [Asparagus officinalis]
MQMEKMGLFFCIAFLMMMDSVDVDGINFLDREVLEIKRMSKRRNVEGDSSRCRNANVLIWTPIMEDKLIDAYLNQHVIGNRVDGNFTSMAYNEIVAELKESFPDKPFDKEKVKNRMKYMKTKWTACYDLFKNVGSGFAWNRSTGLWSAEPEVWDRLIEAHPEAAEWRTKSIRNYDKLLELFAADRANGELAETAAEIRERRRDFSASNGFDSHTIEDIDGMVSRHEILLENFDRINDEDPNDNNDEHVITPETKSTANSQKKTRKSKDEISIVDQEVIKGMQRIAEAIESTGDKYIQALERAPMKSSDVWNHLLELGVETAQIKQARNMC